MFIQSITALPDAGGVEIIFASTMGAGKEALFLSLGEWKRFLAAWVARGRAVPAELDPIDEELYDAIHACAARTAALREAARLLSGGDKSAREIRRKLTAKGHTKEAAEHAVAFLTAKGYLNEEDACARIAASAVRAKHYGKRRVIDYLRAHGYDAAAAQAGADSVPDEDYTAALHHQLRRKYPDAATQDRAARQKMLAALFRQGFSAGEVLAAIKEMNE